MNTISLPVIDNWKAGDLKLLLKFQDLLSFERNAKIIMNGE